MVQRLDDLGIVVAGVVDSRRDLVGVQIVLRIRLAQVLAGVRVRGKPVGLRILWKDDRHPVVDGVHQVVRLRRENRHARDRLIVALPDVPEPSHRECGVVLPVNPIGLFRPAVRRFPLVEPRREDQTGTGFPRLFEDAFLVGSLGASVDDPFLGFARPERNQSPVVAVDFVWSLVRDDV